MENRQSFFFIPARKTLSPHFTDIFTDFEKKNPTVLLSILPPIIFFKKSQVTYWLWSNKTLRKR